MQWNIWIGIFESIFLNDKKRFIFAVFYYLLLVLLQFTLFLLFKNKMAGFRCDN